MTKKFLSLILLSAIVVIQNNQLRSMQKPEKKIIKKEYYSYVDAVKGNDIYTLQEQAFEKLKNESEIILCWEQFDLEEINAQIKKLKNFSEIAEPYFYEQILEITLRLNEHKSIALDEVLQKIKKERANKEDLSEIAHLSQTLILNSQSEKQLEFLKETETKLALEQKTLQELLEKLTLKKQEKIIKIEELKQCLTNLQFQNQNSTLGNIFTISENENELEKLKSDLNLILNSIEQIKSKLESKNIKSTCVII